MKLPHFDQWEVVTVEWVDSAGADQGWHKLKPRETIVDGCTSAGMVYSQDATGVTLVLSREEINEQVDSAITIPLVAITGFKRMAARARR
jgi:hypothetical protein